MASRKFVKPWEVSPQLALPVNRSARAHNRQVEEKITGKKIRRGVGRPAKKIKSAHAITHQPRPKLGKKEVLHLTLKLRRGLPTLRRDKPFKAIQRSFYKYSEGDGFRLVHFSVQHDHLHIIAEADSKKALSRAMHRLAISISRRLNGLWKRLGGVWTGRVFKERYHEHVLKQPLEVRNALLYVVRNGAKHGAVKAGERDYYSSAPYFDGFAKRKAKAPPQGLLAHATAWLLTRGWWREYGLLKENETPRRE
jgi:REP element-mobilizing transposase RayT